MQKPSKKVITKEVGAKTLETMKAKRKEDLKELKQLLKLDADTPIHPRLLEDGADGAPSDAQMGDTESARKRKPSAK